MMLDYLIIGQGLAGSVLSYQLIKNNLKVLVFDDPAMPKSSTVAAGIFNPFTGRKLTKTWLADQLFPYLISFYELLEEELEVKLLYKLPMYRPFLSMQEQNQWSSRVTQEEYTPFIDRIVSPPTVLSQVVNPIGGMMLKRTGYVDIATLLTSMNNFLQERNAYRPETFSCENLKLFNGMVQYKDITARKVIFCDGPMLRTNKFFSWLPLTPVKGEILDIELNQPIDYIANRGVFILPVSNKHCRVGSTFDNQDLTSEITVRAKTQILQKLDKLINIPYQVTGHKAGIRPATLDRRPLIGLHPKYEPLGIFNGLGTKGVTLAPYFSKEFFQFLEREKPLNKDVTINRYFSLYYNKI